MTREEFLTSLQNSAKWDVGVSIARTNPLPLDSNSIFESKSALTSYIETNPLAYPGQIVIVLNEDNTISVSIISQVGNEGKSIPIVMGTAIAGLNSNTTTPPTDTVEDSVPANFTIVGASIDDDGKLKFEWAPIRIDDGVLK